MIEEGYFNKEHTAITKGIFIIMMIIHHALATYMIPRYDVQTLITDKNLLNQIVGFCKICISGFTFLSAYGMTINLKREKNKQISQYFKFLCIRFIKLESSIFFVYILAVLYKRLVMTESIRSLYDCGDGFKPIYMFVDAIGMSTYFSTPEINITWWYLYVAILFIITMPFLYMLYDKYRYLLLPVSIFVPMAISSLEVRAGVQSNYAMLLPSALIGVAFAYEEWFEKIKSYRGRILWIKAVAAVAILKIAFDVWCNVGSEFGYIFVIVVPFIVFEFISQVPILNNILKIIGKNSTNIFLIHTFIYFYWYADIIYSLQKDYFIVIAVIVLSSVLSIIIEFLKKISGYNRLVAIIVDKVIAK